MIWMNHILARNDESSFSCLISPCEVRREQDESGYFEHLSRVEFDLLILQSSEPRRFEGEALRALLAKRGADDHQKPSMDDVTTCQIRGVVDAENFQPEEGEVDVEPPWSGDLRKSARLRLV